MINEYKYRYLHLFNSIQLVLNLVCFGLDCANCYNKERVSLQHAATAQQTRSWEPKLPN